MILNIESVTKTYQSNGRQVEALREATLSLDAGSFSALRGRSGSGKSTLLLVAGGLLRPDRGRVSIAGRDLYAMTADERAVCRARQIGFVFQQFHLVPYLNVLDNILAATLGLPPVQGGDVRARALELAERFGLSHRLTHCPGDLSTGERQRTALARALLNRPSLVLADEPTGNLDLENSQIVLQHLAGYAQEGAAVLLVTHDPQAARFARECYQMDEGRLDRAANEAGSG
jgi:ABC-type lipoprotein export system ATPase subunit